MYLFMERQKYANIARFLKALSVFLNYISYICKFIYTIILLFLSNIDINNMFWFNDCKQDIPSDKHYFLPFA